MPQDRVQPVDFEQEQAELDRQALEQAALDRRSWIGGCCAVGAGDLPSPSKQQRVLVSADGEKDDKAGNGMRHADTLMGKIARQCLTKAIRTNVDLEQSKYAIELIGVRKPDGSFILPAGSACSGTDIWILNMQASSHPDSKFVGGAN